MIGRQAEKLDRLYLTWLDKCGIAETMRKNLASDIVCGYGIANVTKQMVEIEKYEKSVVKKAEQEFVSYRDSVIKTDKEKKENRIYMLV